MFLILSLILLYVETNKCFYDIYDDDVTNLEDALDYCLDLSLPISGKRGFHLLFGGKWKLETLYYALVLSSLLIFINRWEKQIYIFDFPQFIVYYFEAVCF